MVVMVADAQQHNNGGPAKNADADLVPFICLVSLTVMIHSHIRISHTRIYIRS